GRGGGGGGGGRGGGGGEGGGGKGSHGGVGLALRVMMGSMDRFFFFSAVCLSGVGAGVIDTFLFVRLEELGGSGVCMGWARLVMCFAEVPFFFLASPMIKRLGIRGTVLITEVAYLTRFIWYTILKNPWMVLPAEVLHGLTFAAMWAATLEYATKIAPAGLTSTVQGMVTGIHWGLGFGLGSVVGGFIYSSLGAVKLFALSASLPSTALLLLLLGAGSEGEEGSRVRGCWGFRAGTGA
ncbi:unnamed protein product, partial [Discosporangium mesarthrocarpum]